MNSVHLIIFAIVMLGSFIKWVAKKAEEQKAIKQAREMQERRQTEMLRTGRDPDSEQARPAPVVQTIRANDMRQKEMLERRQQQLRELRAKAARDQAGAGEPMVKELWPGGPVIVVDKGGAPAAPKAQPMMQPKPRPVPQARPMPKPAQASQPKRAQATGSGRGVAKMKPVNKTKGKKAPSNPAGAGIAPIAPIARVAGAPTVGRAAAGRGGSGMEMPTTAADWRRALVMAEIFQPPMALRNG